MSSEASNVHRLIQEVAEASQDLPSDIFQDDAARKRLQGAVTRLSGALESPSDVVEKLWFQSQYLPISQIGIDRGWFHALAKTTSPQTAADLARETGSEELLIARLFRPLVAAGFVNETGPQTYTQTPITNALTIPAIAAGVALLYVEYSIPTSIAKGARSSTYEGLPILADLPHYMKKHGYKVPIDSAHGPFFETHGKMQWEYFKDNPERGRSFNTFMEGHRKARGCWLDVYPLKERLMAELSKEDNAVLLVDIGGGRGHDLLDVSRRKGTTAGRLVLQDLPEVIADAHEDISIEPMPYDFFNPQPVKGAKAYYLSDILHDWDTASCRKILQNQALAMKKGYSKLLLNEIVVPATKASLFVAGSDIVMMTFLSGMERTMIQWSDLLESAGLRLVHVWQMTENAEAVIEAVLKD